MTPNFICFFNPYQSKDSPLGDTLNILNNTLRLSNLEKEILQTSLIIGDGYNSIIEFHSNGNMIIVVGSKTNDKLNGLLEEFGNVIEQKLAYLEPIGD